MSSILNLPDGVTPLNLIYIGYPAESKEARTQYEGKRVQWGPFPPEKVVESGMLLKNKKTNKNNEDRAIDDHADE